MSISYHTYVGPIVRVKIEMVDKTVSRTECLNRQCHRFGQHPSLPAERFCYACGVEYGQLKVSGRSPVKEVYGVLPKEELTEVSRGKFEGRGVALLIPNLRKPEPPRQFSSNPYREEIWQDLSGLDLLGKEMNWLTENYAAALGKLREAFGETSVTILWGRLEYVD